jgi:hypothetical protein
VDCKSEDMIGMLAGMNNKVEDSEREVAGGSLVNPWRMSSIRYFKYLFQEAFWEKIYV